MRYSQLIDIARDIQPKRILEIGTWNGARAAEMMAVCDAEYYGFDLFETATDETDREESNIKKHYSIHQVSDYLNSKGMNGSLIRGNTRQSLPWFRKNHKIRFDLAFIDGGHSVDTIASDWDNVRQMMNPGGVVVFDDYYIPEDGRFGCNAVVGKLDHTVLPDEDRVFGSDLDGTKIRMARVDIKDYKLKLPDGIGIYAAQHRSHGDYLATVYEDFEMIKPCLVPGSVLDIGCGLGALSVLAHKHCGGKLYLLDGTGWADRRDGFGPEMSPFNSMDLTEKVMELNGVTDYELIPVGSSDLPEVDNCISTMSWGWHYPLSAYSPRAKVTIADVRPDPVGEIIGPICNGKGFRCVIGMG